MWFPRHGRCGDGKTDDDPYGTTLTQMTQVTHGGGLLLKATNSSKASLT